MANITCCSWIKTCGKIEAQVQKITEWATGLKRWLLQQGLSWTYLILVSLLGPWLWSVLQTFGLTLLITITVISLVHCVLSKAFNACLAVLITKQMFFLRLKSQKGDKENNQLKKCESEVLTYEDHRDSAKNVMWLPHRGSVKAIWNGDKQWEWCKCL